MKINYKPNFISQNINLKKLRPGNSYNFLQKNRNSSFKNLSLKEKKLLLKKRKCPSCNHNRNNQLLSKDGFLIVECKKCYLIFVNPILDNEKYLNSYKSKIYQKIMKSLGEKSHLYRVNRFGVERADYLEKYFRPKKKISYCGRPYKKS